METIIVPTDFSPAASNAVDYAVELAKFFNAKIILVHAYPVPIVNYETSFSAMEILEFHKTPQKILLNIKKEILNKQARELDIECVADMGSPFDVIKMVSKAMSADLIVMGINGEAGSVKARIIGSTSVKVARNMDIPTFIIPETVKYHRIHKISFACDLIKTEDTDLVYVTKYFSKVFDAQLEIVTVGEPLEEISIEKETTNLFIEKKLENIEHKTYHIVGNDVADELEEYFIMYPTDLIMLNPKKHNPFYYLFNHSVTLNLAFRLNTPILAIH